jgi:uncharacterized protein
MALRLLALATLLIAAAPAVDIKTLQPQGYVSDFAGVLEAPAREEIARYCARVERATGAQIAIVTVDDIGEAALEDAANDLFRRWGVGAKGKDEGLLLLLVVKERRMRLEVGRGLEPVIPDGMAGMLLDRMRPALRSGRYAEALGSAAHALGQRIAASKGVVIDDTSTPRTRAVEPPAETSIPWPLLLGGVVLLVWMMSRGGRGRRGGGGGFIPGLILGHMLNRSAYGGYSGGGFGGYDSGDSFGGFGGGDSGGGGASSDW